VNVAEAYPVESFSASAVKNLLAEAQKNSSSADESVANEAKIEVEVLEALAAVAK
jgi:F-type H+-transporting ATPase subunit delta